MENEDNIVVQKLLNMANRARKLGDTWTTKEILRVAKRTLEKTEKGTGDDNEIVLRVRGIIEEILVAIGDEGEKRNTGKPQG